MTLQILAGFLPVFAVIAIGYGVRASGILPRPVWAGVNRLNYRLLLPALLFTTLARADPFTEGAGELALVSAGGIAIVAGLAFACARAMRLDAAVTGALVGTASVWNIVLVLTLAVSLFGPQSGQLAILVIAPGAVLGTLLSRLAIAPARGRAAISGALTDPVIVSCALGVLAGMTPLVESDLLMGPLTMIASASMGIIVLAIGAGLDFRALKGRLAPLAAAALLRALISPLVILLLALTAGLSGERLAIVVLTAAAPTAAFIFALVAEFEGEEGLTAGMITASVLASAVTAPLFVALALAL